MADRWATLWDRVLVTYGRWFPYHPAKWHVLEVLGPKAQATWTCPRVVKRRGVWYELDLRQFVDRYIFYLEYERWGTRFVERVVKPGWVVADVGANIGYYTLLFARHVGRSGCVHAFEPSATTYEALMRNVLLNKANNVRVHRVALADTCGKAPLIWGPPSNRGKDRLAYACELGHELIQVITLDRFVSEQRVERLDLVKVDIEGSEQRFLSGAAETLARFRPIIMIELNPAMLGLSGTSAEQVVRHLQKDGYSLYRPTWRGLLPVRELPAQGQWFNVVALPSELAGKTMQVGAEP